MLIERQNDQGEQLLDIKTVAAELGVSGPTVRRLAAARRLAHHRVGNQIRVSREDLDAYIESTRVAVQAS
jgi:excisionase family DNA binding protein